MTYSLPPAWAHWYLPDAELVYEDSTEKWQNHVREGVNGVKTGPLGFAQAVVVDQSVLQGCRVIKTVVAAHEEEAAEGEHEPTPGSLPDQQFLWLTILRHFLFK